MKNFSLSKKERIKKRKDFETIYSTGSTVYSSNKTIKAIYSFNKAKNNAGLKIAAVVSKKQGSAVWRNRVKRLIKESFRLNKGAILNECLEKKLDIKIIFSSQSFTQKENRNLYLNDFMPSVLEIITIIRKKMR